MVRVFHTVRLPKSILAREIYRESGCFDNEAERPPWGGGWKIVDYRTGGSNAAEPTGTLVSVPGWSPHLGLFLYFWSYHWSIHDWRTTREKWPRSMVIWSCHHCAHCYGFESRHHSSTRADSMCPTSSCRATSSLCQTYHMLRIWTISNEGRLGGSVDLVPCIGYQEVGGNNFAWVRSRCYVS